MQWAKDNTRDEFKNVIWTDKSTVQLRTHKRFCCCKIRKSQDASLDPKHPVKVHVWAGISYEGNTSICIFQGIIDANLYIQILEQTLVPFLEQVYPNGYRFMQDNDPKHTSRTAQQFFREKNINWWRTPPESPDANPIENMWHELKVRNIRF